MARSEVLTAEPIHLAAAMLAKLGAAALAAGLALGGRTIQSLTLWGTQVTDTQMTLVVGVVIYGASQLAKVVLDYKAKAREIEGNSVIGKLEAAHADLAAREVAIARLQKDLEFANGRIDDLLGELKDRQALLESRRQEAHELRNDLAVAYGKLQALDRPDGIKVRADEPLPVREVDHGGKS